MSNICHAEKLKEIYGISNELFDTLEPRITKNGQEISSLETIRVSWILGSFAAYHRWSASDDEPFKNIFVFGCGSGRDLVAAQVYAEHYGSSVDAAEIDQTSRYKAQQQAKSLYCVNPEIEADGLASLACRENRYDFIFAPMFGPDGYHADLFSKFEPAAKAALASGGTIGLYSDWITVSNILRRLRRTPTQYAWRVIERTVLPKGLSGGTYLVYNRGHSVVV